MSKPQRRDIPVGERWGEVAIYFVDIVVTLYKTFRNALLPLSNPHCKKKTPSFAKEQGEREPVQSIFMYQKGYCK
jgi:hypothetical protein